MDARRLGLIALTLVLAACGGSSSTSGTTTSSSASSSTSTTSSTSIPATSTTTTTTTDAATTTALPNSDFDPRCTPSTASPSGAADDPAYATFGPLGATAAVSIDLPTLPALAGNEPSRQSPTAYSARVRGGVLAALGPNGSTSASDAMLAVIGFDGSKRWVRCVSGPVSNVWAGDPSTATTALADVNARPEGDESTTDYRVVSIATGDTTPASSVLVHMTALASSGDHVLFGHTRRGSVAPDALQLYDLVVNTAQAIPLPSTPTSSWSFDEQGEPLMFNDSGYTMALYRDGAWIEDGAAIDAALPPYVDFNADEQVLTGHDASGAIRWTKPALTSPGLEGTTVAADGPITIASICTKRVNGECRAFEVDGVVTATGKIAWTLPGFRFVTAIGGGRALVNDGPAFDPTGSDTLTPGWMMIDTATGKQISGQQWTDPATFQQGCCGESENVRVTRLGGVVVALNYAKLRIWLPKELTPTETKQVSLP